MLLMVEKGIRGGICHAIYRRYVTANNKYMKKQDKNKETSYLMYLDANNLYGWAMSQKVLVDGFEWEENMPKFNEKFLKSNNENSDIGYILELEVEYRKRFHNLHNDLPFLQERMKIGKCSKLESNLHKKINMWKTSELQNKH